MRERESLGKRVQRFLALLAALFAVSAGIVVTQRLSDDTLALLLGLGCGVTVLLPMLVFMVWMWRRQELRLEEARRARPASSSPPVIVVTPQLPPGYARQQPSLWHTEDAWSAQRSERKFTIVGGEED